MNNSMFERRLTLEIFPDELFLELFSFIQPIDLYRGFINLNSRINHILNDTYICIHIINDDNSHDSQACLNYFAHQIIYLSIDCHPSCLSYEISLLSFPNLRSLHLPLPTDQQCDEITPINLPFLTKLTIHNNAFKSVLFDKNSFPYLIACCIPQIYSSISNKMQSCLTLQSLHIGSCSIVQLFQILPYVPNLIYLETILQVNSRNIYPQSYIKHEKLSHFKVKLRKLRPDLEIILRSMPNLSRLEFLWNEPNQSYGERKSFDFDFFSSILNYNVGSTLKHIDIDIRVSKCDEDIEQIRRINLRWFSLLSKIVIRLGDTFFLTTRKLSTDAENELITTLLQSTYIMQRNARFNRIKLDKVIK
ncbi:hypothetical protein I4U23_003849 [Adineta vaga]|nr:hypothetical protein I4U23_003849 [Adineta vaga]